MLSCILIAILLLHVDVAILTEGFVIDVLHVDICCWSRWGVVVAVQVRDVVVIATDLANASLLAKVRGIVVIWIHNKNARNYFIVA